MATVEEYHKRPGQGWWRARLYLGRNPATGKIVRRSIIIKASSRTAAERSANRTEATKRAEISGQGQIAAPITFAELIETWWEANPSNNAASTRKGYRNQIDKWLIPRLGHTRLADLRRGTIIQWRDSLQAEDLQNSTINKIVGITRDVCAWATDREYLPTNPAANIRRLPEQPAQVDIPDPADVAKVIAHLNTDRPELAAAMLIAVAVAARRSEVIALRWQDIEPTRIYIGHSLTPTRDLKPTKTHQVRWVQIRPEVAAVFDWLRARCHDLAEAAGEPHDQLPGHWHVWPSAEGFTKPMDPNLLTRHIQRARQDLGLPRVWMHGLRHMAATAMLAGGVNIADIADILGHSTPALTLKTYSHATAPGRDTAAGITAGLATQLTPAKPSSQ